MNYLIISPIIDANYDVRQCKVALHQIQYNVVRLLLLARKVAVSCNKEDWKKCPHVCVSTE